jgi:hypothetical protein
MKGLFDAEVYVDTVFSIESGAGSGNRFYLSDYGSMHEFTTDCTAWFDEEGNPEYRYTDWSGRPDYLITQTWICPNIFDIRDALQMLDGDSIERFPKWCIDNGHDIATEDPMMLVTRYQDYISPVYESNTEISEPDDCYPAMTSHTLSELGIGPMDIFNDNYND